MISFIGSDYKRETTNISIYISWRSLPLLPAWDYSKRMRRLYCESAFFLGRLLFYILCRTISVIWLLKSAEKYIYYWYIFAKTGFKQVFFGKSMLNENEFTSIKCLKCPRNVGRGKPFAQRPRLCCSDRLNTIFHQRFSANTNVKPTLIGIWMHGYGEQNHLRCNH